MNFSHETVLLNESVEGLNIKKGKIYVDATLGGAGHSSLILEKLDADGHLFVFDQDVWAINNAKEKFAGVNNVTIIQSNFVNLKQELNTRGITNIDGILFDLGVSSMQLDQEERGFSYIHDGPLDMRMNQEASFSASNVVNEYSFKDLMHIFNKYGEEKFAKQIARGIEKARVEKPITTTKELTDIILESIPKKAFYNAKSHPAKRVFQAIRIEVNKELDVFEETLKDAFSMLNSEGRISVITFHSLEDRICKYYFKKYSEVDPSIANLPVIPKEYQAKAKMVTRKPILPSKDELDNNSRSRSAKLRVLERV